MFNKKIFCFMFMILLSSSVLAYNYETIYNVFTSKLDYHITSNMSGENITADNFLGNLNWTYLQNYPSACPSGSALTQLGDTITCTDSWVNIDGDTMTGNLVVNSNFTVDNDFFVNSNTGNVGIGTIDQNTKLHVYSTSENSDGVTLIEQDTATNNPTLYIKQTTGGGNPNTKQGLVVEVAGENSGQGKSLSVITNNLNLFSGIVTEVFTIRNNGNVGIGTTAPTLAKLQVNDSVSGISIYAENNISAEDYLYHSPFPKDSYTNTQALSDLLKIKGNNGKINHLTMPTNSVSILEKPIYETIINQTTNQSIQNQIGTEEESQTSVGMMLGNIIKSIQRLFNWNIEQDNRIKLLEDELCKKDITYSWCKK